MLIELILRKPIITLTLVLAMVAGISPFLNYINIDASPDSLLLESDPDLKYYREVHREYGSDEYIVIGYQPNNDLFDLLARLHYVQYRTCRRSKVRPCNYLPNYYVCLVRPD